MNWIETTVGEYCPFVYGKGLPKTQRTEGDIPVFGSNGCVDYHNKSHVNGPGIIIGRKGSVGAVHLSVEPFWPIDTSFYVEKESIDELKFTYYLLKSLGLEGMNSDSAVPGLNRENAHALPIRIPEKTEDREKLGKWISVYDSKIELNRQTNQTLEQIAQAMFKSWFVDFEPVRAKIAANAAGENAQRAAMAAISGKNQAALGQLEQQHPEQYQQLQATADLFPDNLIDSELGEIPEGWEVNSMDEIVDIGSAKRVFSKEYVNDGIPFYRGKEVTELSSGNNIRPEIFITNERYLELKEKGGVPKEHDILITSVGTIGNTYLVQKNEKFYFKDGNLTWIKTYKKYQMPYFLKIWFDSSIGKNAIENIKIGSTQQAITITSINNISLVIPPEKVHGDFNKFIESNFSQRVKNLKQTHTLSELRDTLLPKLLSGELSIDTSETEF